MGNFWPKFVSNSNIDKTVSVENSVFCYRVAVNVSFIRAGVLSSKFEYDFAIIIFP